MPTAVKPSERQATIAAALRFAEQDIEYVLLGDIDRVALEHTLRLVRAALREVRA